MGVHKKFILSFDPYMSKLQYENRRETKNFLLHISLLVIYTLLIMLMSFISHFLFIISNGATLVAFEAGLYVAVGAWVGLYSVLVVYIATVLSNILILKIPFQLAVINSLTSPLEALGVMLLIRTGLIDSSLEKIQDWLLFAAVQFLVVVPSAFLYVEINAYFSYWPHVWENLGFELLLRIIISHMVGGVLFGGLLIMWFTEILKKKGLYFSHFLT
ncbi:MAG: hypothetical protein J7L47_00285 [Candidatus Odinarchaeota archaeon]|nr:hypothetical protein [Candidatus Odinarchaeota archaeon]